MPRTDTTTKKTNYRSRLAAARELSAAEVVAVGPRTGRKESAQAMRIQEDQTERIEMMMSDEEIRHEITVESLPTMAPESREVRPYVVRDLSWELFRFLDTTESFSSSASALR